ncbi:hypothetical protein [Micromonospora yangpuensis]|uniref:SWIM-type domain-containing protein n=1 Tax=Micromonospora yangpuensis TaxID=683228 RepID=A0A1C6UYI6_9ACTN|nr:hypothetical protein [Micromonospora yangpuensis]GGL95444.1 hypothetical protein GCM10012279_11120 [Micromonospora yangpuensis]SCL59135.1 hypothetical protein GA0070617_4011 [Micromonospora yangpuensis]
MAVRIDIESLRDIAGPSACEVADRLRAAGEPATVVSAGGGVSAVLRAADEPPYEVWVGVTSEGFTVECDCPDEQELCAHAVAVTTVALADNFAFSSAATPPSAVTVDPKVAELADLAGTLPARRLAFLIAEYAATDRVLEARLRAHTGRLAPPTDAELADIARTVERLADESTSGYRWDLHDVAKAGQAIVEEVQTLAARPVTEATLLVVERAARAWDGIAGHLMDAWETYEEEPAEIGGAIRAVHVQLCEQAQPDPDELMERLTGIIRAADTASCLDEPWDYVGVLGRERIMGWRRY